MSDYFPEYKPEDLTYWKITSSELRTIIKAIDSCENHYHNEQSFSTAEVDAAKLVLAKYKL